MLGLMETSLKHKLSVIKEGIKEPLEKIKQLTKKYNVPLIPDKNGDYKFYKVKQID
jgi:hypothetical protein